MYRDFAMVLIAWAQKLYKDDYFRLGLTEMVYAFDSSTIELCLKLFLWAEYKDNSDAMKNTVFAHMWIAVCDYLLPVIVKRLFHIK